MSLLSAAPRPPAGPDVRNIASEPERTSRPQQLTSTPEVSVVPDVMKAFEASFADWVAKFPFLSNIEPSPQLIKDAQAALDPQQSCISGVSVLTPKGRRQMFSSPTPGVLLASMAAFSLTSLDTGVRHENPFLLPSLPDLISALGRPEPAAQNFACAILLRGQFGVSELVREKFQSALSSAQHVPDAVRAQVRDHFRL